jgi:hypothetical protein
MLSICSIRSMATMSSGKDETKHSQSLWGGVVAELGWAVVTSQELCYYSVLDCDVMHFITAVMSAP